MKNYKVKIRRLKVREYQTLRKTTGWLPVDDQTIKAALKRDLFSICIFDSKRLIGMGRVVGDGAIYFYIQDIVVIPEYQGKGIGRLIMEKIELFISEHAGNNSFIGLMAAKGIKEFYLKFDFLERPKNQPGMYKLIKKDECNNPWPLEKLLGTSLMYYHKF